MFGAGALAAFYFAGEDGDDAVLGDVESRGNRFCAAGATATAATTARARGARLGQGGVGGDGEKEAGAEEAEDVAAGGVSI
jgi:hypothetical protein